MNRDSLERRKDLINTQNKKINIITATQKLLVDIQDRDFLFPPEIVSELVPVLTNGKYISSKCSYKESKTVTKRYYQYKKVKLTYNFKEEKIEIVGGVFSPNFNRILLLELDIEKLSSSIVFNRCFNELEVPEKYGEIDYLAITDTEGLLNHLQKLILKKWTPKVKEWSLSGLPEDKILGEIPYLSNHPKNFLSTYGYNELKKGVNVFTNYESKQLKGVKDTWNFEEYCKQIRNEINQKVGPFLNNQKSFDELVVELRNNNWLASTQDLSYCLNLFSDFGFSYEYLLQFLEQVKKNALSGTATEQDVAAIGELLTLKDEVFRYDLLTREKAKDLFVEFYLEWNKKNLKSENGRFMYLNSLGSYSNENINEKLLDIFSSERYKEEFSYKQLILPNCVDQPLKGTRLKQFLQVLDKNHNKIFISVLDKNRDNELGGIATSRLLHEVVECLKKSGNNFDVELVPQEKKFFENIHFLKYFLDRKMLEEIQFLLNYKK